MKKYDNQGPLVTVLIIVIFLLIAAIITVSCMIIVKTKPSKKENKINKIDNKASKNKITDYTKYQKLLNVLYNNCFDPSNYIDLNTMSNDDKINLAISELLINKEFDKIVLNNNDSIDMTGCTKKNNEVTTSDGMILYYKDLKDYTEVYSKNSVEEQVKKIFGKDTIINNKTTNLHFYDKSAQAYIAVATECSHYDYSWFQAITKVEEKNNKLYIYTSMASLINLTLLNKEKICFDYDTDDCILLSELDEKYKNEKGYENYMKDNINKFAKYKYTFEKEDSNYVIKKLEKID